MRFFNLIIILFFLLLVAGCRKDEDISDNTDIEYPSELFINTSVKGTVKGSRGFVVTGAVIQIGSVLKTSDFNGYFHFENISTRKSGEVIKVEKPGFRTAYKTFYPQKDGIIYIDFELVAETGNIVINTGDNKKLLGNDEASIEITGNSFVTDGQDYTGMIQIKPLFAHPDNFDFFEKQFGDPIGYDKYFKTKGLNSFGIVGIEMFQSGGNKIDLGSTNRAELRIKNTVTDAPVEISVWKYNFEKKKWLETNDKAKLVSQNGNTYYIAEVKSAGFYNLAQNFDVYEKELTITSNEGVNAQFINVGISAQGLNYKLTQRASNQGKIITFLPLNKKSDIAVNLNDKTFTETIKKEESTIKIPADHKLITVKGLLKDCSGNPVNKGYITIISNKDTIFFDVDQSGSFNCNIIDAKNEPKISWMASDTKNEINTFIHKSIKTDISDLGEIYVCSEPFAFVQFGEEKYTLDLKMKDITSSTLALEFIKGSNKLEIVCLDFKGEKKYDLNTFPFTFAYNESATKRLFPVGEYQIVVDECNKPGMIRGTFEGKAKKNFDDETIRDLKIKYSVRLE